ncbi:hypothetical protein ACWKS2_28985 [Bacillus thuringiensis]
MNNVLNFVPYEEIEISRMIFDEKIQKHRVVNETYKLRLTDHWREQLLKLFSLNVFEYYAEMCTEGSIVDERKFTTVVWALLNGGGHCLSGDDMTGFMDMVIKTVGIDYLAMVVTLALTGALMPLQAYKELQILMAPFRKGSAI